MLCVDLIGTLVAGRLLSLTKARLQARCETGGARQNGRRGPVGEALAGGLFAHPQMDADIGPGHGFGPGRRDEMI